MAGVLLQRWLCDDRHPENACDNGGGDGIQGVVNQRTAKDCQLLTEARKKQGRSHSLTGF